METVVWSEYIFSSHKAMCKIVCRLQFVKLLRQRIYNNLPLHTSGLIVCKKGGAWELIRIRQMALQ